MIILALVTGKILRLPKCKKKDAKFSQVKNDYKLIGSVVATFEKISNDGCVTKCISFPTCKSLNFHGKSSTCELVTNEIGDEGAELKRSEGWSHVETPKVQKLVISFDPTLLELLIY